MSESALTGGIAFLFGICIGSFLNVCIWRIPQNLSIVLPASRCPKCGSSIRPYDNIPVMSWLILGGKCRACRAPISPIYPAVELLTGLVFVAGIWTFGLTLDAAKWITFLCILIVLFFTDIFFRILPDEVNLFGAGVGLVLSVFLAVDDGTAAWLLARLFGVDVSPKAASVLDAVLGSTLISAGLWIFAELFSRAIGRAAMGFGDVKMMAMMGTFLGVKKSFLTLLLGTLLGSVLGVLTVIVLFAGGWKRTVAVRGARRGLGAETRLRWALARRYQLPLGTFLAVGAAAAAFFGAPILEWYARFVE